MAARILMAATLIWLSGTQVLRAQEPGTTSQTAVLRGTVRNTTDNPLVYAVITIPALGLQQFSNNEGKFYFVQVKPGKYSITIRQLGYSAVTREVVLSAGQTSDLPIVMTRLATRLATMLVNEKWECRTPGRPKAKEAAELLEVFEQLEQSAVRLRLINKEFPTALISERRFSRVRADSSSHIDGIDSIRTVNSPISRYKPGKVIVTSRDAFGARVQELQIPSLLDFADMEFQKHHCFVLRGIDNAIGTPRIRVDFQASVKITTPDIEGSVFLEPTTYRLLSSEIRLTRIPSQMQGLAAVGATTIFKDIAPGLPSISEVIGQNDFSRPDTEGFVHSIERQTILRAIFLRAKPAGVSPPESTRLDELPYWGAPAVRTLSR